MSCTFKCQRLDWSSFYFIAHNSTCLCTSVENDIVSIEDVSADIIYGIRKEKENRAYIPVRSSSHSVFIV
jgi:hypothetical protein